MAVTMRATAVVLFAGLLFGCGSDGDGLATPKLMGPYDVEDAAQDPLHDGSAPPDAQGDAGAEADGSASQDGGQEPRESDSGAEAVDSAVPAADSGGNGPAPDAAPCVAVAFRDADGDGFGDPATGSCVLALGYVANADDCYDGNANAWPGKTGSFSMHRGDGSYDYDCDGAETGHNDRVAVCPDMSMATCPPTPHRRPTENCDYEAQTAPWHVARDAWSRALPPCGTLGVYGLHIWWEVSIGRFQCAEMPADAPPQSQQLRGCH